MTENSNISFRGIIENVLNRWTGLKLAVDHGAGGKDSFDKALYLIDFIEEIFKDNATIEVEDLEDTIADYMEAEFHIEFENNDIKDLSSTLLRLNQMTVLEATEQINQLPACVTWLVPRPIQNVPTAYVGNEENNRDNMVVDDEWTTVTYKKKT